MKNFALIGAAGFIAERHMRAIKETNNQLIAATDLFDVMGRMDSFFPEADFFLDFENFSQFISNNPTDYLSICSPNFKHAEHIQFALNKQAHAICEKPLVLHPDELDQIANTEKETGKRVFNILQLRLHPSIIALKEKIANGPKDKIYDIDLTYITSRGKWYYKSWKGDLNKSGGVSNNIGIHFFDMLQWIFGGVKKSTVNKFEHDKAAGFLELENARVRWYLSLDSNDIPEKAQAAGMRTYRSITIEGQETEFSDGFTNLHTKSYQEILAGNGFGLEEARASIELAHNIANSKPVGLTRDYHPFLR